MQFVGRLRSKLIRVSSWIALSVLGFGIAWAHSVGQVQTTKFLAPETVSMLLARAATTSPGLAVGDVVSYIIQFTPVGNGALVGAGGYITDYIPPGTEVVGAAIVAKDSLGNFNNIAPNFPGGIDSGWGDRGQNSFAAPFNTAAYDTSGRCAAAGFVANCDARINEIYADTGIFYSTDPRTAVFPALPTRILQGTNGYDITPTAEAALNTIIGQTRATTHNLWDANQTNAFGTSALISGLTPPASTAPILITAGKIGQGPTPYNAGSAVAGPQSGYQLDNTGNVGPWQRIAYSGSRMGDNTTGPATNAGSSNTAVAGFPTSIGVPLSVSNPLPAGTNAVRWAVGKLVVGEIRFVKISLRITAPVPSSGIVNSSEVFGGDAGDGDAGQDNPWRYHVPSVADNNSNLLVQKAVVCVYNALNVCVTTDGSYVPAGSKVRYRITYLNAGVLPQTNFVLQDVLPCQTAANAASNIAIISGPVALPSPNPPNTAAGNCGTTPDTRSTVTFPTLSTLAAGGGGSVELDVLNNASAGNLLANTAKLTTTEVPGGVTSNAISNVGAIPNLSITKVANNTTTAPGGTSSYTIVVSNIGAGNATGISLYDVLPSMGGVANASTRFSYLTTTAVLLSASPAGSSLVLPAVVATSVPPTLSPYDTSPVASNSQQILWTFGASVLVPGGVMTLTYTTNVGVSVSASATPYYNNANVLFGGGGSGRSDAPNTAPVVVTSPLSVTKTVDCYFVGTNCVAIGPGGTVPPSSKIRYTIAYANNGLSSIANVILSDTLPCQTAANSVSNIQIIAGPIGLPVPNPPSTTAGVCPGTRVTFSFPASTLAAGQTGTVKVDVQTNAVVGAVVVNTAGLSGTGVPSSSSDIQASVAAQPVLQITKTSPVTMAAPGTTLSYTITVSNIGTTAAQSISIYDWLPTSGPSNDITTRFSYVNTTAIVGLTAVVPVVNRPPTQAPYNVVGTNANLNNQEEVVWNFGTQTLAAGSSLSITFNALVGLNMPLSPPSYDNTARASFSGGSVNSGLASAKVALMSNLSVTKTNGTSTLAAGSIASYTITFSNLGPSAANAALVKDAFTPGLSCTTIACVATTGTPAASCPSSLLPLGTPIAISATNFFTTGETIATFPANSSVSLVAQCSVTATGQ